MERKIVIGLITNTEFSKQIRGLLTPNTFQSSVGKILSGWCLEYFDQYNTAPGQHIAQIYQDKLQAGSLAKDVAEEIEEDILPDLNEEYLENPPDTQYLVQRTTKFINEQNLEQLNQQVEIALEKGNVEEAQQLIDEYRNVDTHSDSIDLTSNEVKAHITKAFAEKGKPLIKFPGALGDFWGSEFTKGSFIGLLAPEKRGKTFLLMDILARACRQGVPVAFFQAGDMSQAQQLRRISTYLTKKPFNEKYVGINFKPVKDCIHNQMDTCDKSERECDFGVFSDMSENEVRELKKPELLEVVKAEPDYLPCHNCRQYRYNSWGVPWLEQYKIKSTITEQDAIKAFEKYFINNSGICRMSSHPTDSLSMQKISGILANWKNTDGFEPKIILIDYADILAPPQGDFRQGQNAIWKGGRRLSLELDCCVVMPTQSDSDSYKRDLLRKSNFSEDKRKYAHVTAMYGLNQDTEGRDKGIGLLRLNKLVIREDEFSEEQQVTLLQALNIGRPVLGSYL